MTIGIYKIVCAATGDTYIGASTGMAERWYRHKNDLCRGVHSNKRLQQLFNEHGLFSFSFEVLEITGSIEKGELARKELEFIQSLQPSINSASEPHVLKCKVAWHEYSRQRNRRAGGDR